MAWPGRSGSASLASICARRLARISLNSRKAVSYAARVAACALVSALGSAKADVTKPRPPMPTATRAMAAAVPNSVKPRVATATYLRMREGSEPPPRELAAFNEFGLIARLVVTIGQWSVYVPSPFSPCARIGTRWQAGHPWPTLWRASLQLAVLPPLVLAKSLHPYQALLPPG